MDWVIPNGLTTNPGVQGLLRAWLRQIWEGDDLGKLGRRVKLVGVVERQNTRQPGDVQVEVAWGLVQLVHVVGVAIFVGAGHLRVRPAAATWASGRR